MFEVEPLPVDGPRWTAQNCFVTPDAAGGRKDQDEAIVKYYLANLAAFQSGGPMVDRVV